MNFLMANRSAQPHNLQRFGIVGMMRFYSSALATLRADAWANQQPSLYRRAYTCMSNMLLLMLSCVSRIASKEFFRVPFSPCATRGQFSGLGFTGSGQSPFAAVGIQLRAIPLHVVSAVFVLLLAVAFVANFTSRQDFLSVSFVLFLVVQLLCLLISVGHKEKIIPCL